MPVCSEVFIQPNWSLPRKKLEIVRGSKYRNTKISITFHTTYFIPIKTSILAPGLKLTSQH